MYLGFPSLTFTRFFDLANGLTYKQLFGTEIVNTHAHMVIFMHANVGMRTNTHTHTHAHIRG